MSLEEIMVVHTVHQLRRSGEFYNDYHHKIEFTKWDKVAERLYDPWRLNAFEVTYIYLNWKNEYMYDYQEDTTEDGESDESVSCEKIGLVLAATFGDPLLNTLIKRNRASWRPAFHRVDRYWKRLSKSHVLIGHSWESVKAQTIVLLKMLENLCTNKIPFLDKYETTPPRDFTYEQNMFLVAKVLKLGVLTPFPQLTSWVDLAELFSRSKTFPYGVSSEELAMLSFRIRSLVSLLNPPLSADALEMLDTVRELQKSMIGFDPWEEEFWEALRNQQAEECSSSEPEIPNLRTTNISELESNYKEAMRLYRSSPPSVVSSHDVLSLPAHPPGSPANKQIKLYCRDQLQGNQEQAVRSQALINLKRKSSPSLQDQSKFCCGEDRKRPL
ncbi:MAG: hypothetical protein M1840_000630 [Geoglossum simile]|nr:MAG: hypothetical protein M1840_000630 [Geoglossum simile]